MLATYTVADRIFDLWLPTAAKVSSIFLRICWVWPLASADGSAATMPARYTVSPWTTAWLNRGPTPCRLMLMPGPFRSEYWGRVEVPKIVVRAPRCLQVFGRGWRRRGKRLQTTARA